MGKVYSPSKEGGTGEVEGDFRGCGRYLGTRPEVRDSSRSSFRTAIAILDRGGRNGGDGGHFLPQKRVSGSRKFRSCWGEGESSPTFICRRRRTSPSPTVR